MPMPVLLNCGSGLEAAPLCHPAPPTASRPRAPAGRKPDSVGIRSEREAPKRASSAPASPKTRQTLGLAARSGAGNQPVPAASRSASVDIASFLSLSSHGTSPGAKSTSGWRAP